MRNPWAWVVMVSLLCLTSGGCISSENGLSDGSDLSFDPTLIGEWRSIDRAFPDSDEFRLWIERSNASSNEYVFSSKNREGKELPSGRLEGVRLIHLDGVAFLDVPLSREEPSTQAKTPATERQSEKRREKAHLIFRLRKADNRIALDNLSGKFLKQHPEVVRHVSDGGSVNLTATTEELRRFVRENARNKEVWELSDQIFQKVTVMASPQTPTK